MSVCMHVCPSISRKQHCFSSVFAKMMSKNTEFFQIFGKRMQEAQASKKAGRGNQAWDPCFATPGPRRLRLVERHQIAARSLGGGGPPPRIRRRVGVGGVILYPLFGVRHVEQCRRISICLQMPPKIWAMSENTFLASNPKPGGRIKTQHPDTGETHVLARTPEFSDSRREWWAGVPRRLGHL